MVSAGSVVHYLTHPTELRAIIQWKLYHLPVHERDEKAESENTKKCFYFLDLTSRSFAAVIKELHPELLVPVCIFYLILRGLDTIEDDMTIPLETKLPILKGFDKILEQPGWSFDGNHEREKDRQLLVEFDCVIQEYAKIKPAYQKIITDITKRMGDGMAYYCDNAEHNENGVNTVEEYEKYCHYVAGLVGEGCTRLFVEAGLALPALLERPELMESMGQFLQQTNIIRDIKEDYDDNRRFYPKQIWSQYVDEFEDLFKPENREKALNCSAEMILLALHKVDECLYYLAGIKEQSVFNFCAIPQTMAIATLNACFRNYALFQRNVKISKGEACEIMTQSTQNLKLVTEVFKKYTREIHKKSSPQDPHYLEISIACGKIEQFIEKLFPSQKAAKPANAKTSEQIEKERAVEKENTWELIYMGLAVLATIFVCSISMVGVAYLAGARFDLLWQELTSGTLFPKDAAETVVTKVITSTATVDAGHVEL
ncbi:ERG9, squalene synthase [Microthyrium microscopicum]|uniref:Squalene synthase n=1 Tax=Microthyrium microscopicum TaxID=703497 RepID=A0A6A6UHM8_9PEZI|nr:ERG9, squalene synthase [Microthyrium microscopicum]